MIEQPKNLSEKTLACLVLDRSGSMDGTPINELNAGIHDFLEEIKNDPTLNSQLEVSIITFDDQVEILHAPSLAENISFTNVKTGGTTAMVDAVRKAIEVVENRKAYYKSTHQSYKLPWIVLVTDGSPDSDQDINGLAQEIEKLTKAQKFMLMPIGVQGADMAVLNTIAGYQRDPVTRNYIKMSPASLKGMQFKDFFKWLSVSMSAVVNSADGAAIKTPDPSGWATFSTSVM